MDELKLPDGPLPLTADEQRAVEQLYSRYAQRLVGLAEQHLNQKLARRVDGEEVMQSVFRTFCRRHAEGKIRIDSSAEIWHLLVKMTVLKARARARYHTADKRNVAAEVSADREKGAAEAVSSEPGPAEGAAFADLVEALLQGLTPAHGAVLRLLLEGRAVAEIAAELKLSRQTIYRIRELFQKKLAAYEVEGVV
jgi:RNA polymerase sigma-70 factor (ECF subfamily)